MADSTAASTTRLGGGLGGRCDTVDSARSTRVLTFSLQYTHFVRCNMGAASMVIVCYVVTKHQKLPLKLEMQSAVDAEERPRNGVAATLVSDFP